MHGKSKRRTWRKFHIGIDVETQDILCCELTGNNKGDAEVAEKMFGEGLKARSIGGQESELICKCIIINKMNKLGMPKGKWILEAA